MRGKEVKARTKGEKSTLGMTHAPCKKNNDGDVKCGETTTPGHAERGADWGVSRGHSRCSPDTSSTCAAMPVWLHRSVHGPTLQDSTSNSIEQSTTDPTMHAAGKTRDDSVLTMHTFTVECSRSSAVPAKPRSPRSKSPRKRSTSRKAHRTQKDLSKKSSLSTDQEKLPAMARAGVKSPALGKLSGSGEEYSQRPRSRKSRTAQRSKPTPLPRRHMSADPPARRAPCVATVHISNVLPSDRRERTTSSKPGIRLAELASLQTKAAQHSDGNLESRKERGEVQTTANRESSDRFGAMQSPFHSHLPPCRPVANVASVSSTTLSLFRSKGPIQEISDLKFESSIRINNAEGQQRFGIPNGRNLSIPFVSSKTSSVFHRAPCSKRLYSMAGAAVNVLDDEYEAISLSSSIADILHGRGGWRQEAAATRRHPYALSDYEDSIAVMNAKRRSTRSVSPPVRTNKDTNLQPPDPSPKCANSTMQPRERLLLPNTSNVPVVQQDDAKKESPGPSQKFVSPLAPSVEYGSSEGSVKMQGRKSPQESASSTSDSHTSTSKGVRLRELMAQAYPGDPPSAGLPQNLSRSPAYSLVCAQRNNAKTLEEILPDVIKRMRMPAPTDSNNQFKEQSSSKASVRHGLKARDRKKARRKSKRNPGPAPFVSVYALNTSNSVEEISKLSSKMGKNIKLTVTPAPRKSPQDPVSCHRKRSCPPRVKALAVAAEGEFPLRAVQVSSMSSTIDKLLPIGEEPAYEDKVMSIRHWLANSSVSDHTMEVSEARTHGTADVSQGLDLASFKHSRMSFQTFYCDKRHQSPVDGPGTSSARARKRRAWPLERQASLGPPLSRPPVAGVPYRAAEDAAAAAVSAEGAPGQAGNGARQPASDTTRFGHASGSATVCPAADRGSPKKVATDLQRYRPRSRSRSSTRSRQQAGTPPRGRGQCTRCILAFCVLLVSLELVVVGVMFFLKSSLVLPKPVWSVLSDQAADDPQQQPQVEDTLHGNVSLQNTTLPEIVTE